MRKLFSIIFLLSLMLVGCGSLGSGYIENGIVNDSIQSNDNLGFGSSNNDKLDYESEYIPNEPEIEVDKEISAEITLTEEKLVYSCDITIETKTYNDSYSKLKELMKSYNVVIESEHQTDDDYNWYYEDDYNESATLSTRIVCRVPSEKYDEFIEGLCTFGVDTKVTSKTTEVQNITQQYYDSSAELESLEIQEERLLALLSASDDIDAILTIEDSLSRVRYKINSLKTTLSYMDLAVSYSYVTINLEEVKELTTYEDETTFFSRIFEDFKDAGNEALDMFEELISMLFRLIPFILFVFIPAVLVLKLFILIFKKITGIKVKKDVNKSNSFKFKTFSLRPKRKILHDDTKNENK